MTNRVHVHATEAEARTALEAIDAARGPTETLETTHGKRGRQRLAALGLVTLTRGGELAITDEGRAAGLELRGGALVEVRVAPAKPWAAEPMALKDGSFAVPVCSAVAGREATVRGSRVRVPDESSARALVKGERVGEPDAEGKG